MKSIAFSIGLICLFASGQMSFAHPGGLDENGGHVNKKTGVYHYHKKKKSSKKNSKPAPKKPSAKKPADQKKSPMTKETPAKEMSEDEPDFSIFDKLTAENEAMAKKKKPALQPEKKSKPLPKIQVLKTERSNSKAIIYVRLLDTKSIPTDKELIQLSRKLDSGQRFLIYYFLPTMKADSSPWAIALETTAKNLGVTRFDKRAPKSFQPLLKQKVPEPQSEK